MSRVAKKTITLPAGVELKQEGNLLTAKSSKGSLDLQIDENISVEIKDTLVSVKPKLESSQMWALAGTIRSVLNNMIIGVNEPFTKTLIIQGVGYRAQLQGSVLNLNLGFSHPVEHQLPNGVSAELPNNTTIVLKSVDKQKLGQVAADIRAYRAPEPYKGKGIRYSDERVLRKEAKKK